MNILFLNHYDLRYTWMTTPYYVHTSSRHRIVFFFWLRSFTYQCTGPFHFAVPLGLILLKPDRDEVFGTPPVRPLVVLWPLSAPSLSPDPVGYGSLLHTVLTDALASLTRLPHSSVTAGGKQHAVLPAVLCCQPWDPDNHGGGKSHYTWKVRDTIYLRYVKTSIQIIAPLNWP